MSASRLRAEAAIALFASVLILSMIGEAGGTDAGPRRGLQEPHATCDPAIFVTDAASVDAACCGRCSLLR